MTSSELPTTFGETLSKVSSSYRAILSATAKYGFGPGFSNTWNLYGGRLLTDIAMAVPSIIAGRMFMATSSMASTAIAMIMFNCGAKTCFDWW